MSTKAAAWPAGYGLHHLVEVDSTLNEAARIAPQLSGPIWIWADRQTAGRGRQGRKWVQRQGNLAATLVMRPEGEAASWALRSFVAALALAEAVTETTGRADGIGLKWPNDVLLNGGKLAGILLESASQGAAQAYLAIGIGVNLVSAPPQGDLPQGALPAVSLASETGVGVAPEDFLNALAGRMAWWEARFCAAGFAPIRDAWLARAAKLGQSITARTGTRETVGTFETIDAQGNLVLATQTGRVAIPAAEIYW